MTEKHYNSRSSDTSTDMYGVDDRDGGTISTLAHRKSMQCLMLRGTGLRFRKELHLGGIGYPSVWYNSQVPFLTSPQCVPSVGFGHQVAAIRLLPNTAPQI